MEAITAAIVEKMKARMEEIAATIEEDTVGARLQEYNHIVKEAVKQQKKIETALSSISTKRSKAARLREWSADKLVVPPVLRRGGGKKLFDYNKSRQLERERSNIVSIDPIAVAKMAWAKLLIEEQISSTNEICTEALDCTFW